MSYPPHIVDLAKDALAASTGLHPDKGSPSILREVIADWFEENGFARGAMYLRPRPQGYAEATWLSRRRMILEGIVEPSESRSEDT